MAMAKGPVKCPHCNQTPIWDQYERCTFRLCGRCDQPTWACMPDDRIGRDPRRKARLPHVHIIYVCRLCNEAVT